VVEITTDDAWVRDTGPTFVTNSSGEVRGVDWAFNAWGGLQGRAVLASWMRDDQVARKILKSKAAGAIAPKASCWKAARSMSTAKAP
jgi:agmatine/peptidylarginine deiminase